MSSQDEILLQQELSKGSDKAFEQVFNVYFKMLVVFAKKYVQDISTAEDLVQDVYLKLYEKRLSIQFHTSLKAFLFQSVYNRCVDYLRSAKVKTAHHERMLSQSSGDDFQDQMLQVELEERIYKAIEALPDQCALIFKKSRFDGKKNQEIADELSISKRTVETQISKAFKAIEGRCSSLSETLFGAAFG